MYIVKRVDNSIGIYNASEEPPVDNKEMILLGTKALIVMTNKKEIYRGNLKDIGSNGIVIEVGGIISKVCNVYIPVEDIVDIRKNTIKEILR